MIKVTKGIYTGPTGWRRLRISERPIEEFLECSGEIDDELWLQLEHYSEVSSAGIQLLVQKGIPKKDTKRIFVHFQAHIRQAKTYYLSAKSLTSRASALSYYYCFLNLSKAAILFSNPKIAGKPVNHGLSVNWKGAMKGMTFRVTTGIFPMLYQWYFGIPVGIKTLSVKSLLNYCTDIGYQCAQENIGTPSKIHRAYYVSTVDKNKLTSRPIIGIERFNLCLSYKKTFANFLSNYEEIDLPEPAAREYFNISNAERTAFTFFQLNRTLPLSSALFLPIQQEKQIFFSAFKGIYQPNYFKKIMIFR